MMKQLQQNSYLFGGNAPYVEGLYETYLVAPESVPESWREHFDALQGGPATDGGDSIDVAHVPVVKAFSRREVANGFARQTAVLEGEAQLSGDRGRRQLHAETVRRYGHLWADLDPLERREGNSFSARPELRPECGEAGELKELSRLYGGRLAVETSHLDDPALCRYVIEAVEENTALLSDETLLAIHRQLVEAEEFERFLGRRFPGKKKFGAEGAEGLIVLLDRLLSRAVDVGVDKVVIGTMHRGRLNLVANVLRKDLAVLLAEFKGAHPFAEPMDSPADVPYHQGVEAELLFGAANVHVTLLPNPSHLEAVDPVVLGRVRALQDERPEGAKKRVLGIVLHTDAAVIGQGVVAETIQFAGVAGFSTCGTIHVVVNNQIGFTTEPHESRTSRYCTGAWKSVDSLILHVNGDDPRATVRAADLAVDFRQDHGRDAVIDLVVYRRNGHNELDEPRFTQPLLYEAIDGRPSVREMFEGELILKGLLKTHDPDAYASEYRKRLDCAYQAAESYRSESDGYPDGVWSGYSGKGATEACSPTKTGASAEQLTSLLKTLSRVPEGLRIGKRLTRLVSERAEVEAGVPWAVAEALAFATLVIEQKRVRLSGQDVVRGAFSHRHFALTDATNASRYFILQSLTADQAPFAALNSPLSEYATLGFEYGYSLHCPEQLVIWEAQFGDFANGAQIMIDQFICSGEAKWRQPSGLVLLLPHGLEGQGPEHSSARIERYLQLAAAGNMTIVNPSTPANYFHALRHQVLARVRKPLIIIAPKTLLRLPEAVSPLDDFETGTSFTPLIVSKTAFQVRKILLCSGKIAYELERGREQRNLADVLIVRIERLYPAPITELADVLGRWPEAELIWVQEEPENMGAWSWYDRKLENAARAAGHRSPKFAYCGRPESASPAGSFHSDHRFDQAAIVDRAFA